MGKREITSLVYGSSRRGGSKRAISDRILTDFRTILTQNSYPSNAFETVNRDVCSGRWDQLTGCVSTNHYPTVTDSDFWTQLTADSADSSINRLTGLFG